MSFLEIAVTVENLIQEKGGEPAFPCNVCENSVAAHYTPTLDDDSTVKAGSLLKIDLGVHINGYLVDTATTLTFTPEYGKMTWAVEDVLSEAVRTLRVDTRISNIGKVISQTASRHGYRTIQNLSGHMVEPYKVHAGVSIPNTWVPGAQELKKEQVYAIEPFLTVQDGAGLVVEGKTRNIYSLITHRRTGERRIDDFIEQIWSRFKTLPFTPRYFPEISGEIDVILNKLVRSRILRGYPVLVEAKGCPVAQAEHTVVLSDGRVIVLT